MDWIMRRCIKLFTGNDGRSHVEEIALPLGKQQRARVVHFEESPPHATLDWHTAPCLQYVVTLTGTLEFTTRDGETFVLSPGDVLLADDTTGTGHRWRLIDDDPWRRLYVELDSQDASIPGKS
jgi:quercetin dioxygenase-like cupin family protein